MIGLISSIPQWGRIAIGALLGAAVAFGPIYLYGKSSGKSEIQVQAAKDAINRIQEMESNNAAFKNLPARERCIAFMRDSGLPVSECD